MDLKKTSEEINQNIVFADIESLKNKLKNFINSYKINKKNLAVITDFDYTITKRFIYSTNYTLNTTYRLYDEDIIGGNQQNVVDKQNELYKIYRKFEEDTSIDINIRKEKIREFYKKSLDIYINPKFSRESVTKMIDSKKETYGFRNYIKEYIDLLISMEIPVIIISGGITQFIEDLLKIISAEYELYLKQKKIFIISNTLIFDNEKGCIGYSDEIVDTFNKSSFVKYTLNQFYPDANKIFVLGDHLNDYDAVHELNMPKENIIGISFVNIKPSIINDDNQKENMNKEIDTYKKIYDINLVGDTDYTFIIKLLEIIKNESEK